MNIFEEYLKRINKLIFENQKLLKLKDLNNFNNIVVEVPPPEFNFDLSCNASLVLAKLNKLTPIDLANKIKDLTLKNIKDFKNVKIAGPGFLNIELSQEAFKLTIEQILKEELPKK